MSTPSPQTTSDPRPLDTTALRVAGYATVVHLLDTASTMDEARRLAARADAPLPAVVVADRQTLGRGRQGARWWQAPGSLAASLVIDSGAATGPAPLWSLACGIALVEVLAELAPTLRPRLRWPNDVEVGGRKLAGILVEAHGAGRAIFGIGVNTTGHVADAPPALRGRIVTVPDTGAPPLERTPLLAALLPRLAALLDTLAVTPAALVARYQPWCGLEGRVVTLHLGGSSHPGTCLGIAADGALVLDTAAGPRAFTSGSLTAPDDAWHGEA
jgi:BirA family biotin operon repressor/biotin-[acetyl-CoA-carboxylase] ligase